MTDHGRWNDSADTFTATDGREFAIFSEQVRGESRFWSAMERAPSLGDGSPGSRHWRRLPDGQDGSYGSRGKRTQQRRIERYVRETIDAST